MKLTHLMLLLVLSAGVVTAQTETPKPTKPTPPSSKNKAASAAAKEQESPAPPRPGMVAGIQQQVALQELNYKNAALEGDTAYLKKILAAGYVSTNPDGVVLDRAQTVAMLDSGGLRYESLVLSEMKVHGFGTNVVVVNGRGDLKGTINGRDVSGAYRYTRVWLKQGGSWRVIAFQASRLAPPATAPAASTSAQPK